MSFQLILFDLIGKAFTTDMDTVTQERFPTNPI